MLVQADLVRGAKCRCHQVSPMSAKFLWRWAVIACFDIVETPMTILEAFDRQKSMIEIVKEVHAKKFAYMGELVGGRR